MISLSIWPSKQFQIQSCCADCHYNKIRPWVVHKTEAVSEIFSNSSTNKEKYCNRRACGKMFGVCVCVLVVFCSCTFILSTFLVYCVLFLCIECLSFLFSLILPRVFKTARMFAMIIHGFEKSDSFSFFFRWVDQNIPVNQLRTIGFVVFLILVFTFVFFHRFGF